MHHQLLAPTEFISVHMFTMKNFFNGGVLKLNNVYTKARHFIIWPANQSSINFEQVFRKKMCNSGQNCAPLGWVEWHEGMCKHVKPWDIRVGSKGTTLLPLSSIGEIEKWLSQQEKSLSLLKSKQVGNELSFEWVIYLHSTMVHCHCTIPWLFHEK